MSSNRLHALPQRGFAVVFGVLIMFLVASGQTLAPPDDREIKSQRDRFAATAFTSCEGSLYAGPFSLNELACSDVFREGRPRLAKQCQMVLEMRVTDAAPHFEAEKQKNHPTPAEFMNGLQWQGLIKLFNNSISRKRLRADATWLPWGEWHDQQSPVVVAALWKKNGVWYASDLRNTGQVLSNTTEPTFENIASLLTGQVAAGSEMFQQQFGPPITLDRLLPTLKQPSCSEMFSDATPAPRQPVPFQSRRLPHDATGHSLSDTYARTVEIMNENTSKGVRDAIGSTGWLTPLDVCYSINQQVIDANHTRRVCEKTGEVVRVPGDLAVPAAFWENYLQSCKAAGMGGLAVKLTNPLPNDGRQRFMSCTSIGLLGAEREELISMGLR